MGTTQILAVSDGIASLRTPDGRVFACAEITAVDGDPAFTAGGVTIPKFYAAIQPMMDEIGRPRFERLNDARSICALLGPGWHVIGVHQHSAMLRACRNSIALRSAVNFGRIYEWVDLCKLKEGMVYCPNDSDYSIPESSWTNQPFSFDVQAGEPIFSTGGIATREVSRQARVSEMVKNPGWDSLSTEKKSLARNLLLVPDQGIVPGIMNAFMVDTRNTSWLTRTGPGLVNGAALDSVNAFTCSWMYENAFRPVYIP